MEHLPQVLGRAHPAGEAAGHPDDRDRLVAAGGRHPRLVRLPGRAQDPFEQQPRDRPRVRVVERERRRQRQPGRELQAVAQLDRGQGIESQFT